MSLMVIKKLIFPLEKIYLYFLKEQKYQLLFLLAFCIKIDLQNNKIDSFLYGNSLVLIIQLKIFAF